MSIDRSENRPAIPSGSRLAREGRIKADSRILDQLREPGTPGHRDFTREGRTSAYQTSYWETKFRRIS